ncbi:MAG: lipoyl(octanoyl) transferase LipB [Candidatus Abyssobacteria bacterium SURF_5]|uniref:Octanoyltransferase n=1 Tax=Abyssobacteria bacterium (strain SURF_5) TaxID=2093360 RepID=A0A3A4NR15_ABYX5|nr:MAG: lipoyl(octanoyl) transferase LipB [Candidatus Abyssubacteria bacterium SURF_5]
MNERLKPSPAENAPGGRACEIIDLAVCSYAKAYAFQKEKVRSKIDGADSDTLILVEHFPVLTLGRRGRREHICAPTHHLRSMGIDVIDTDRGGDVTYHGPGQLVGYPILDLRVHRQDVNWILRSIEASLIRALEKFGIRAGVEPGLTGVWVNGGKIAAIGIGISRWITFHGFALNVAPKMDHFQLIIPCGIRNREVISMEEALGKAPPMEEVKRAVIEGFCATFGLTPSKLDFPSPKS